MPRAVTRFRPLSLLPLVLFLLGLGLWFRIAASPVGPGSQEQKLIVIKKGSSITGIGQLLEREGLIRSPLAFRLIVSFRKLGTKLQAGSFRLSPSMSASEIAENLTRGRLDAWLTIPEGFRTEEIAALVEDKFGVPRSDFVEAASDLEGKLFPDSYLIPEGASASTIVSILYNTYLSKIEPYKESFSLTGLSETEILTLASILERETRSDEEKPIVAGILLKRLSAGWPLQVDATLQYIRGKRGEWWPLPTSEDKRLNSPYNTYLNSGLPPGPIANPGLASITAVLSPTPSSYWYYLHDDQGKIHFAATLEEHNANISRYIR